jgi:hypothetical protein
MRGRTRTIKPELFADEQLGDLEQETGLPIFRAFVGLLVFADREGRFRWAPRALKGAIAPCWGGDFARALEALASKSFVVRYTVNAEDFGFVRNFHKHQTIHPKEAASVLPDPAAHGVTAPVIGLPVIPGNSGKAPGAPAECSGSFGETNLAPSRTSLEVGSDPDPSRVANPEPTHARTDATSCHRESVEPVESTRLVLKEIPADLELDDELRAEAITAGCDPARLNDRWRNLKSGPIGGRRGIFAHKLRDYIRGQFGSWKTWDETDRAQQQPRAGPTRVSSRDPRAASAKDDAMSYLLEISNPEVHQ